jgi:hypothetical protein
VADPRSIEYGSLHKFFVSAGIAVFAFAGVVGWALLQKSGVLFVSTKQLARLTKSAEATVESQQQILSTAVHLWLVIVGAIAAGGAILIILGLRAWLPLQRMENAVQKHAHDTEMGIATPAETHAKQSQEIAAERYEMGLEALKIALAAANESTITVPAAEPVSATAGVEAALINALEAAYSSSHVGVRDPSITDGDGTRLIVDLLLKGKYQLTKSYAVEIKRMSRTMTYHRYRDTIYKTEHAASLLAHAEHTMVLTRVIFVVDDDVDRSSYPPPAEVRKKTRIVFLSRSEVADIIRNPAIVGHRL